MPDFHIAFRGIFYMTVNLRHGTDGFTSPTKGRRAEDFFFALKKSDGFFLGFETAKCLGGSKGQRAASRHNRSRCVTDTDVSKEPFVPIVTAYYCTILERHICMSFCDFRPSNAMPNRRITFFRILFFALKKKKMVFISETTLQVYRTLQYLNPENYKHNKNRRR
jgi:hypothetical protein